MTRDDVRALAERTARKWAVERGGVTTWVENVTQELAPDVEAAIIEACERILSEAEEHFEGEADQLFKARKEASGELARFLGGQEVGNDEASEYIRGLAAALRYAVVLRVVRCPTRRTPRGG